MRVAQGDGAVDEKAAAREALRELYDNEIAYCDAWIGQLLSEIQRMGLRERTVIILTADHGEAFWERGVRGHGRYFQDEILRVPLVLALPGGDYAGSRIEAPVRLVDIMPTVLELTGIQPPDGLRGRSLTSMLGDRPLASEEARELLAECRMALPEQKALRSRQTLTVYRSDTREFTSYSEPALFPLGNGEEDLSSDQLRERLLVMSTEMAGVLAESKQDAPALLPEQKKELEALGYL